MGATALHNRLELCFKFQEQFKLLPLGAGIFPDPDTPEISEML